MGEGTRRYRTPYPVVVSLLLTMAVFGGQTQQQQSSTQNKQTDQKTDSQKQPAAGSQTASKPDKPVLTAAPTVAGPNGQQDIQLNALMVNVPITVTDPYGRFVTGLTQANFEVYEDKVKQEIKLFSDSDAPVSIGIVFDVSGSMKSRINRSH